MLRMGWIGAALLACVVSQQAFSQQADPRSQALLPQALRPAVDAPPAPSEQDLGETASEIEISEDLETVDEDEVVLAASLDEFVGYRYGESSMDWIFGGGDQLGMFSLIATHYLSPGENSGFGVGYRFHFLDGPTRTEMPSRVFDFSLSHQWRKQMGNFSYDIAASVMASSDFEGSSREGIRFPGHAVGFLRLNPTTEFVFGVDYLDQGNIKLLPVAGLIVVPNPDVRLEFVFPRPRAVFRLTDQHLLLVQGELGGSSWAIERDRRFNDLATYRDLRLSIGIGNFGNNGETDRVEIAYLFSRRLDFTSGQGSYRPRDTAMVRWVKGF